MFTTPFRDLRGIAAVANYSGLCKFQTLHEFYLANINAFHGAPVGAQVTQSSNLCFFKSALQITGSGIKVGLGNKWGKGNDAKTKKDAQQR